MAEAEVDPPILPNPTTTHETNTNGSRDDDDTVTNLQNQLKVLQNRLKELELENAKLSSQLSTCRCRKESKKVSVGDEKVRTFSVKGMCDDARQDDTEGHQKRRSVDETKEMKSRDRLPGSIIKTMHHSPKRYIALKIMYFGQRFYGFASAQVEPTVESEIFKALEKTRLLVCDKTESRYTRCGRTDKGVSSVGQVISLLLRSKSGGSRVHGDVAKASTEDICEEIDYVRVLNGVLPRDIRVISWCAVANDFHARFGCLSREYKYLFWRENLDLLAMETAGKNFVGEHDFRNFCKMDAANVHNYRRHITSFEISRCCCRSEDDQLWAMTIKGSAFLWHQIRCMVAVLFMIGRGLEHPSVINELLDTNMTPRKPQYVMAPELPLVLRSCEFEGLKFVCSPEAGQSLHENLKNEIRYYKLQAAIFQEALQTCSSTISAQSLSNHVEKKVAHVPLVSRPTEPTYEERQAKQRAKIL